MLSLRFRPIGNEFLLFGSDDSNWIDLFLWLHYTTDVMIQQVLNRGIIIITDVAKKEAAEMEVQMKKTYKIEVDCANCANLMETATQKVDGIKHATVNFMTQKMIVEFEDGADISSVMKQVLKTCKKVEPDCEIEF